MKDKSITKIQNFIDKGEPLSKEFIHEYIVQFICNANLRDYLDQIVFNKDICGYLEENKTLYIKENFIKEIQKKFLNGLTEKQANALKNIFTLDMIHHELNHIILRQKLTEGDIDDRFFLQQLEKANMMHKIDVNLLNKKYYNTLHFYFLFEANSDMYSIFKTAGIVEKLDLPFSKEIYNQYAAQIIAYHYQNNTCPIVYSNRIFNLIINDLKKTDVMKYSDIPVSILAQTIVGSKRNDIYTSLLKGYEISEEYLSYINDVAVGNIKTKKLFK